MIVPESAEPAGLLSLFKGKFIVHKTTVRRISLKKFLVLILVQLMAKPTHLYCVSGEKSLQMKTTEVRIAHDCYCGSGCMCVCLLFRFYHSPPISLPVIPSCSRLAAMCMPGVDSTHC